MKVTTYKTNKITVGNDLFKTLDTYLPHIEERTIIIITSKIISLSQNDVVKNDGTVDKKELIKKQADWYFIDKNLETFGTVIPTITNGVLIANAGIDESNADGYFICWPTKLDRTTETIWEYARKKHNIKELGIIITDSRLAPLRYGTQGVGIAWCGFEALQDYRGKPDIFGEPLKMTQKNILDGFAGATVVLMGEGEEQTPLATITDIPFVVFQDRLPTKEEKELLKIDKENDIYGKLLTSVKWEKGGK
jgi:putative folate metabolism gamma-glutamate ligase